MSLSLVQEDWSDHFQPAIARVSTAWQIKSRFPLDLPPRFIAAFFPGASNYAMDGLGPEMRSRGPSEDERKIRIRDRVLNIFSAGNADLQRRGRRIRFEGSNASIPCHEGDQAADLKARQSGGTESRAAVHVPGDGPVGEFDVVRVRALTTLRRVGSTRRSPVVGHRHVR